MPLPFRIRQSSLEDARCLYRFHRNHVLGLKEPSSEFAARGSDFHELARRYVNFLVQSQQEQDWSYADELAAAEDWNPEGAHLFKEWAQRSSIDPKRIFATEFKIRLDEHFKTCAPDDAVYSGDLDRLDIDSTQATITDYKTFWAVREPTSIQSIFYPWLLFKLMPHLTKITFVLEFVRYHTSRRREFERSQLEQMDKYVQNQVLRLIGAYEADEWPASVNSQCTFCGHPCPLVEAGLSQDVVGQVRSVEHAQQLGQQLYALRRAYLRHHAILKAYAAEHGPVDLGNAMVLGFAKKEKFEWDARAIRRLNEEHGFAPERALVGTNAELKKIAKQYPEYVAKAKAASRDRSTTVFKFWNEAGDPLEDDSDEE